MSMSIPRKELCGATLGSRALKFVLQQMKPYAHLIEKSVLWTDSIAVVYWLCSGKKLKKFVQNRVYEVKKVKNLSYRYVNTSENPADLATRGVEPNDIVLNEKWWHAPPFLKNLENSWPKNLNSEDLKIDDVDVLKEEKEIKHIAYQATMLAIQSEKAEPTFDVAKFSSWVKLKRSTAYALKFIRKIMKKEPETILLKLNKTLKSKSYLSGDELGVAEMFLLKQEQAQFKPH
uniref:Uncharacterized protein n=1 Tax=Acrobeloides nanus TaxID=290746 RepID=A0A914EM08_9BILA